MRVSEATEKLYMLFGTPKLKCVHTGDWERNESVYVCHQKEWEEEVKKLVECANASNDSDYLDCFQTTDDRLSEGESCACFSGLKYDDCGEFLDKDTYTLDGRTIDYDGFPETSKPVTPDNQLGWCRLYGSTIGYYQYDKYSFWLPDGKRDRYSLRMEINRMVNGKPSSEKIIVVVK